VRIRVFGTIWNDVTEEWRKLHNEELNYPYSSPNVIREMKSIRKRWSTM